MKSTTWPTQSSLLDRIQILEARVKVLEEENFFSIKLNKKCSSNWSEIDKSTINSLELFWCGTPKVKIERSSSSTHKYDLTAKDWFFSQKGCIDMGTQEVKIISRNIGYKEEGLLHIFSILEGTGELILSSRPAD